MRNDTKEIRDLERQQNQTYYDLILCDRCRREFYRNKNYPEWEKRERICSFCLDDQNV